MKQLKDNLYQFESVSMSRMFLIKLTGKNVIVDTSFPGKGKQLIAELAQLDITPDMISDILITHHDIDHIGNAAELQAASGATVWMHELDLADDMGGSNRPILKRFSGLFIHAKRPTVTGIITGPKEILPGIQAIPTPGHTPGHTVYMWQHVVFSGDAVRVTGDGRLKAGPTFINANQADAVAAALQIEALPYQLLCPA
jgi:glyoxylase-like metal-dependent hydrolase (beta-lactamase superfamily II)